jgi:hypothetical protein
MQKQEPGTINIEVSALALRTDLITRINREQSFLLFDHYAGGRAEISLTPRISMPVGFPELSCEGAGSFPTSSSLRRQGVPLRNRGNRPYSRGSAARWPTETVYQQQSQS